MIQVFCCNPWESVIAEIKADNERDRAELELSEDLDTENDLARKHALGELECPWPWYADTPTEVQKPEIIHGAPF